MGLRHIRPEGEPMFLQWHNDVDMRERIGGIFPFTAGDFQELCRSGYGQYPSDIWFAVCEEDDLIGIAGLHSVRYIRRNAEVAMLIGEKENRGKGKGRAVLGMIEKYAFGTLALHRLYALVYPDNYSAMQFLKSADWSREGVMQDAAYWNYQFRDVAIWARIDIR